eukprot:TRINITY_DN4129_c0_g1_i1.p1 TRINITY_DN4129_c0_g1~~TRINITY_DN4129_c0_g1_i1.p1  ORF type:complete len:275 (-),score=59.74 TRINITY_DN4129_c0_g1_i1:100-924(-)
MTVLLDVGSSQRASTLPEENDQLFITRIPDIDYSTETYFLLFRLVATTHDVCIYTVHEGVPTRNNYDFTNCTSASTPYTHGGYLTEVIVPVTSFPSRGAWPLLVVGPQNEPSNYLVRVDAEKGHRSGPPPPTPSMRSCPRVERDPKQSLVVAGPLEMESFCYYLTLPGQTCDAACSAIGGSNLIDLAIHTFPEGCPSHCDKEPVNRFQEGNANVFHWTDESHPTAFQTCGYGYERSYYVCHCRNGSQGRGGGALVGDYNNHDDRSLICPCFFLN